jgi:hypothetical protein
MLKRLFLGGLRRQIGRIEVAGAIDGKTRERVLKALKEVEENQIPAVVLRIDSPGGTVADSKKSTMPSCVCERKRAPVLSPALATLLPLGGFILPWEPKKLLPTQEQSPVALV